MVGELQYLYRTKEAEQQKSRSNSDNPHSQYSAGSIINSFKNSLNSNKNPDKVVLGGQVVDEKEFEDENLCQICCFLQIDTEFVPCQHQTCKNCIQTHMLNNERCPFCQAEIERLKPLK